jgi:poly [ADP-ribose] polymerase
MTDLNNGSFKVQYGRVGGSETVLTYPMRDWDKKYNEKIKKGYIDVTEKVAVAKKKSELDIEDKDVKDLIQFLMECARQSIKRDYIISADEVTQEQINEVQITLNSLNARVNSDNIYVDAFNNDLKYIYTIIPRKMYDTRAYFLKDKDKKFVIELLQTEQQRLDTLKSQISLNKIDSEKITLNDLGFTCEIASEEDREFIRNNTDFRLTNHRVFKISNNATEVVFNPNKLKTKLLYHGSRNENFLSILQTGLKIRPKGVQTTGSMFGDGIYAANKARKSIGYTSLRGSYWASGSSNKAYLAIFEFATGKEWKVLDGQKWSGWMGRIDKQQVTSKGYDSVFAQGGADLRNDEYIVYDSTQVTIRYLIELTEER